MTGLIGRKLGMTRVFDAEGAAVPVTVIEAGPCPVVQVAGNRIELGFGARKLKRTARALLGHVKRAGLEVAPRVLQSFSVAGAGAEPPKPGEAVTVALFPGGGRGEGTGGAKGGGVPWGVDRPNLGGGAGTPAYT